MDREALQASPWGHKELDTTEVNEHAHTWTIDRDQNHDKNYTQNFGP